MKWIRAPCGKHIKQPSAACSSFTLPLCFFSFRPRLCGGVAGRRGLGLVEGVADAAGRRLDGGVAHLRLRFFGGRAP